MKVKNSSKTEKSLRIGKFIESFPPGISDHAGIPQISEYVSSEPDLSVHIEGKKTNKQTTSKAQKQEKGNKIATDKPSKKEE